MSLSEGLNNSAAFMERYDAGTARLHQEMARTHRAIERLGRIPLGSELLQLDLSVNMLTEEYEPAELQWIESRGFVADSVELTITGLA